MRVFSLMLALAAAQVPVSASAGDLPPGSFKTWGGCMSAYSQLMNDEWRADREAGKRQGMATYTPTIGCALVGDVSVLVPYPGR